VGGAAFGGYGHGAPGGQEGDGGDEQTETMGGAFAAQVIPAYRDIDIDQLNVHGGAIALGHPADFFYLRDGKIETYNSYVMQSIWFAQLGVRPDFAAAMAAGTAATT
jgi:hypothetical protein